MKIYQIHATGGEWEDSYDIIHSSYLDKNRAYEEKNNLDKQEQKITKKIQKCSNCPLFTLIGYDEEITEDIEDTVKSYCKKYKPDDLNGCQNYLSQIFGVTTYNVYEVDVIE